MKILLVSDSHTYDVILKNIIFKYREKVDFIIHCGDSSFDKYNLLLPFINIIVQGNHDYPIFPLTQILIQDNTSILITHGHKYNVYQNYDLLYQKAKENHCHFVFHGHTHVPSISKINDIYFINPGSTMMNRGSYGFGTYALIQIDEKIDIHFYHHQTHICVDSIVLDDGKRILKEFKKYATKKQI